MRRMRPRAVYLVLGTVADPSEPAISHFCLDKRALNLIVLMPVIKVVELVGDCSSVARPSPAEL